MTTKTTKTTRALSVTNNICRGAPIAASRSPPLARRRFVSRPKLVATDQKQTHAPYSACAETSSGRCTWNSWSAVASSQPSLDTKKLQLPMLLNPNSRCLRFALRFLSVLPCGKRTRESITVRREELGRRERESLCRRKEKRKRKCVSFGLFFSEKETKCRRRSLPEGEAEAKLKKRLFFSCSPLHKRSPKNRGLPGARDGPLSCQRRRGAPALVRFTHSSRSDKKNSPRTAKNRGPEGKERKQIVGRGKRKRRPRGFNLRRLTKGAWNLIFQEKSWRPLCPSRLAASRWWRRSREKTSPPADARRRILLQDAFSLRDVCLSTYRDVEATERIQPLLARSGDSEQASLEQQQTRSGGIS